MFRLDGRRVVVMGGGMGIGLAAANILAELGADVFVGDCDTSSPKRLPDAVRFCSVDAMDVDSVEALFAKAEAAMGGVDGAFTTVGGATLGPFSETDLGSWRRELAFNLDSAFIVGKAALPSLRRAGGGSFVMTSSGYAIMAGTDRAAYSAAKAGVISFSRSLAALAAPHKVRVNCIAPGPTDTPRFREMNGGEEGVEKVRKAMPLGAIPKPEDCANLAVFLLSDAAAQITGQTIHINGGLLTP